MEEIKDKIMNIINNTDEYLSRAFFYLVPEGYRHNRGDILYKPIGYGLELQYKVDITDYTEGGNIVVFEKHLDNLDISKEEFFDKAYDNTIRLFPPKFDSVCEMLGFNEEVDLPLYCLTNIKNIFGAGTILYPRMKEKLEDIIGSFIVIPSSVHEVLLLPDIFNKDSIKDIIQTVNTQVVSDEEILSDRVYKLNNDNELIEA